MAIDTATQARAWGNYVGGEWIGATGGETFDVINPATEEVVGSVPKMTREDAQRAIATARETFDSGVWSGLAPDERSRILLQVVEKFTENEDELAALETQQAGMTIRATSTVVIGYCINHWDYFARAADRQMQEPLEPVSFPTHSYNFVLREPIGVCAGIIPWNFPLVMAVWKLAPALAMGNTIVLKPASNTPLTALRLAELLDETDLPKGVVNVITGSGASVARSWRHTPTSTRFPSRVDRRRSTDHAAGLIDDQEVHARAGWQSPNIVYEDANLQAAVDGALWATFFHQGQVCESGTRLILPESIHDDFVERLVERAKTITLGDTMDYDTDMGPLVSAEQLETVTNYVRIGQEEGAKLVLGGKRAEDLTGAATSSSRRSSPTSTTR